MTHTVLQHITFNWQLLLTIIFQFSLVVGLKIKDTKNFVLIALSSPIEGLRNHEAGAMIEPLAKRISFRMPTIAFKSGKICIKILAWTRILIWWHFLLRSRLRYVNNITQMSTVKVPPYQNHTKDLKIWYLSTTKNWTEIFMRLAPMSFWLT